MSQLKLPSYPKRFTRNEINAAKTANAIEGANVAASDQKQRMDTLKVDLDQSVTIFMDEWINQANLAVTRAAPPPDKRSHRNWFIALAGNLLWAGTVFVPATQIVAVLSIAGAVVGTGPAAEFDTQPPPPQDPRELVTKKMHEQYPKIKEYFSSEAKKWAWEIDANAMAGKPPIDFEKYVWDKMFSKIKYATRHDKIYTAVKANMEAMLADYSAQWQAWLSKNGLESMSDTATWFKFVMYKSDPFKPDLRKHWAALSDVSR